MGGNTQCDLSCCYYFVFLVYLLDVPIVLSVALNGLSVVLSVPFVVVVVLSVFLVVLGLFLSSFWFVIN